MLLPKPGFREHERRVEIVGGQRLSSPGTKDMEKPFRSQATCIHLALGCGTRSQECVQLSETLRLPGPSARGPLTTSPLAAPHPGRGVAPWGRFGFTKPPLIGRPGERPPAGEPSAPGQYQDGCGPVCARLPHSLPGPAGATVQAGWQNESQDNAGTPFAGPAAVGRVPPASVK